MSREFSNWKDVSVIVGATVATTLAIGLAARVTLHGKQDRIIRSPREALVQNLTDKEKDALPYPPNCLPGGRDVQTPYGSIHVYEFGPETGRKVLLVHGITTPCIALGGVALGLAEKECRVMLFDLFGRGYSDGPTAVDYDDGLYCSQIMFVISSSDLDWTTFSLIGYSLGGGIVSSFASYFPKMIESLVLLAPSGLLRAEHIGSVNQFLYSSGIVPESVLLWFVKRKLQAGPMHNGNVKQNKPNIEDTVNAEAKTAGSIQDAPLSKTHPNLAVLPAVKWQVAHHHGFVNSFLSSLRYAPISGQEATWKRLDRILSGHRKGSLTVLVITGSSDALIIPGELKADLSKLIGAEHYRWILVDGGHDFPSTKSVETVERISDFWGL